MVQAADPLQRNGLRHLVRSAGGLTVSVDDSRSDVALIAIGQLDAESAALLRQAHLVSERPVVLVVSELNEQDLQTAASSGIAAVLPRDAVTMERLARTVRAAAMAARTQRSRASPDLIDEATVLLRELRKQRLPGGRAPVLHGGRGFREREIDVLRLVAEGLDTVEIAAELHFSERTVKYILSAMSRRLGLHGRPHAVAVAIRLGEI